MLKRAFNSLVDILMPPLCIACKEPLLSGAGYCARCWGELRFIGDGCCDRCGVPLPVAWRTELSCLGCHAEPPDFDRARAPFAYAGVARQTVLRFKHGGEHLAELIAGPMARAARPLIGDKTLVLPVPLHPRRLFARGYNQSALLARAIAAQCAVPLLVDGLRRVKPTPPTAGAGRRARALMMAGAFRVPDSRRARIAGADVLLVDDVMTTGATASASARALRRAGAGRVDVVTYARVVPDDGVSYLSA